MAVKTHFCLADRLPAPAAPPTDQVLLLAMPEVDAALSIGQERLHESLARTCASPTANCSPTA